MRESVYIENKGLIIHYITHSHTIQALLKSPTNTSTHQPHQHIKELLSGQQTQGVLHQTKGLGVQTATQVLDLRCEA